MSIRDLVERLTNQTYDLAVRESHPRWEEIMPSQQTKFQEEIASSAVPSAEDLIFKISSGR
jgi:hypothetical protein